MKPLIVIRPQPGCDATVEAARTMGLEVHGFPLFEVHPQRWTPPDPKEIDALLIGSANAIRHGSGGLWAYRGKPVYAVGATTAEAARAAGLDVVASGEGGLQALLAMLLPEHRRLLRMAGRKRVELIVPAGVTIVERVIYSSDPEPMPDALASLLRVPAVVMLHSREAALHFAAECERLGVDRDRVSLAAIGPRVVRDLTDDPAAPLLWQRIGTARSPDEAALLALSAEMCQEPDGLETTGVMEAEVARESGAGEATPPSEMQPLSTPPPARRRSARGLLGVAMLAFVLGAGAVVWSASQGYLDRFLPSKPGSAEPAGLQDRLPATGADAQAGGLTAVGTVEARLAMVEDRISRLNLQAEAASGNAARAEGLLIAFATRRMIDRGEPLRHLSDQLRLRFSDGQPRAVATIVAFAQDPVTLDQLSARLEALAPGLTEQSSAESFWTRASREISGLFVVRRDSAAMMSAEARLDNARVMLTAGRVSEAADRVGRMPGAAGANKWIADARRYAAAQNALDVIETAAMLQPNRLHDPQAEAASETVLPVEEGQEAQAEATPTGQ